MATATSMHGQGCQCEDPLVQVCSVFIADKAALAQDESMLTRISAILAFLGVVLGAFGAHKLEAKLEASDRMDTWETAVFYHLVHAVVLFVLSWRQPSIPRGPWWSMAIGVVLFSGSLYALCLTGVTRLGAITPLGGVAFLIGWGWLVLRGKQDSTFPGA